MELQPIHKLMRILETNETPEEEEVNKEWIKLTMLVDSDMKKVVFCPQADFRNQKMSTKRYILLTN